MHESMQYRCPVFKKCCFFSSMNESFSRTNRERSVQYAFTIILQVYEENFWNQSALQLEKSSKFKVETSEKKFVHIFYRSRKSLTEYIPLALSYFFLLIYIYFSVSKIQMVKSKWGLAFSAVFTVSARLAD